MAGGPAPVELSADCTVCGLEAGVVELYDALVPACRFGVPATSRCKLCGIQQEGVFNRPPAREMRDVPANGCPACVEELGPRALDDRRCAKCGALATLSLSAPAAALDSQAALVAALDAWATRDQWSSREALTEAVFCDPDLGSLLLRIRRGEPLEVIADPFANMGVRTTDGRGKPKDKPRRTDPPTKPSQRIATSAVTGSGDRVTVTPSSNPLRTSTPSQDFRANMTMPDPRAAFVAAPTDALAPPIRISVPPPAVAVVNETPTMTSAGTPGALVRPSLPTPPPPTSAPPRAIVYPLVSVIVADGEIHPAERALIDRYENMSTSLVRQLWMKLRRFVLSARWSEAGQEGR